MSGLVVVMSGSFFCAEEEKLVAAWTEVLAGEEIG